MKLLYVCILIAVLTGIISCSPSERQPSHQILELTVLDNEIRDYRGNTLLTLSQLPNRVYLDADTNFSAHTRFVQAKMSPKGNYIAVTTSGTAHAAAWVYSEAQNEIWPAAFQYGGNLEISLWQENAKYLTFMHQPPAGGTLLSVADIGRLSETLEISSTPVKVPQHDDYPPERHDYKALDWDGDRLHFLMASQRWTYQPGEGVE